MFILDNCLPGSICLEISGCNGLSSKHRVNDCSIIEDFRIWLIECLFDGKQCAMGFCSWIRELLDEYVEMDVIETNPGQELQVEFKFLIILLLNGFFFQIRILPKEVFLVKLLKRYLFLQKELLFRQRVVEQSWLLTQYFFNCLIHLVDILEKGRLVGRWAHVWRRLTGQ